MARALAALIVLCLLTLPILAPGSVGRPAPNSSTCVSPLGRDVVIVFDRSASMLDQGKLASGKSAADALLATLSPSVDQSALVSFASNFTLDKGLSFNHTTSQSATNSTQTKVDALAADGATALGAAVRMARYELDNGGPDEAQPQYYSHKARAGHPHIMVVLTDGDQTLNYADPVQEAYIANHTDHIRVITVALGTDISPSGIATLQQMASSPDEAFVAPDPTTLTDVFRTISYQLNDTQVPVVSFTSPVLPHFFNHGTDSGASPIGVPTILGAVNVTASASDDCVVDHVAFSVDGAPLATANDPPYYANLDCEALSGGLHTLSATVVDWLGKSSGANETIACVRAHADSRAEAAHAYSVDPPGAFASGPGASLGTWLPHPGVANSQGAFAQASGASPVPYSATLLRDQANGTAPNVAGNPEDAFVASLSRQANVTLDSVFLGALQTNASARVNDTRLNATAGGAATRVILGGSLLSGSPAATATCTSLKRPSLFLLTVDDCFTNVTLGPGVSARLDEVITVTSVVSQEVTVNAVHLIAERPEGRAEVVLSQSYAGASWLGAAVLHGPVHTLDWPNDAGTGADAPGARTAAVPLTPGVYGGRLDTPQDVDAYAVSAQPGQKVRVVVAPADGASAALQTLPTAPSFSPTAPVLVVRLLDPQGATRDLKASLTSGAPVPVELNVDAPGAWVVTVSGSGVAGYAMHVDVETAPMTRADDALLGQDAGGSCDDALLVGPGEHLGTLEDGDAADWYRFPLAEGQLLALTLRPGDTPDAAAMDLQLMGPDCRLIAFGTPLGVGIVKGAPESVLYNVPTGASGLYRAGVLHRNGLGTYELGIATSVATTP